MTTKIMMDAILNEEVDPLEPEKRSPVEHCVGERVGKYKCGCDIGTKWRWRDATGQITQGGRADAMTIECVGCGQEWNAN